MLSVAMVVKNEEKTLRETIQSVKEYADEIVIGLDKASDDGTSEIAEEMSDKIIPIYLSEELKRKGPIEPVADESWGFSKARNIVFSHCNRDNWRLVLDGHETVLMPSSIKEVIDEAKEGGYDGVEVNIRFEPDENDIPKLIYRQGRLFAPSVRYNNPLHNVPVVKRSLFSSKFEIEHRKKDQDVRSKRDRDAQRSSSTIEGFEKAVAKSPNDSRPWFYLGNAYKENGRWKEAIDTYIKYLEISTWKEERWHARVNMGTCYSYTGDTVNAREQFSLALEEFPEMAEAYYYLADLAYKQKKYREAQVWLEKCVSMDMPKCRLFLNPKIYMADRYDLLSMTYHHVGEYHLAIEQAKLVYHVTKNERIANNIRCWKQRVKEGK